MEKAKKIILSLSLVALLIGTMIPAVAFAAPAPLPTNINAQVFPITTEVNLGEKISFDYNVSSYTGTFDYSKITGTIFTLYRDGNVEIPNYNATPTGIVNYPAMFPGNYTAELKAIKYDDGTGAIYDLPVTSTISPIAKVNTITVPIAPNECTVEEGESIEFTATVGTFSSNVSGYEWKLTNKMTGDEKTWTTTSNKESIKFDNSGNYVVTLSKIKYYSSWMDINSNKASINVNSAKANVDNPTISSTPKTGDSNNIALYISILIISLGTMSTSVILYKKKYKNNK